MREISPSTSHSCEEFLRIAPPMAVPLVQQIREQKQKGTRPVPSTTVIDQSCLLQATQRAKLLDRVAMLVDENLFGRAEMCEQFATLLAKALQLVGLPAQVATGQCSYFCNSRVVFTWQHFWVRVGPEVIDANTDCLTENPVVPTGIVPRPYWGAIQNTPPDRRLRGQSLSNMPHDIDVETIWWPELKAWLSSAEFCV